MTLRRGDRNPHARHHRARRVEALILALRDLYSGREPFPTAAELERWPDTAWLVVAAKVRQSNPDFGDPSWATVKEVINVVRAAELLVSKRSA